MTGYLRQVLAIADVEMRKLLRDPTELVTRAVQPLLWLLVFGQVFARFRGIETGGLGYLEFLAPGVLAQSVLFGAIFYGIAVIWERDMGVVNKLLVSPAPRSALVLGKALSSGARGMSQAVIIYVVALCLRVHLRFDLGGLAGTVVLVMLGSAAFSTLSLVVACLVRTRERFMGIGQLMTMPLFFASNAIYPLAMMPAWLRAVASVNPLSYLVDGLRTSMIAGSPASFGLGADVAVLVGLLAALAAVATRLYPALAQ